MIQNNNNTFRNKLFKKINCIKNNQKKFNK